MEFFLASARTGYIHGRIHGAIGFWIWDRGQVAEVMDIDLDQGSRQGSLSRREDEEFQHIVAFANLFGLA